jgi:chorismate synthase
MNIETDTAEIVSGVRFGKTIGSPVTLVIYNKDYENWQKVMSTKAEDQTDEKAFYTYRPHLPEMPFLSQIPWSLSEVLTGSKILCI